MDKTKAELDRERAVQMSYVDRLFDNGVQHGTADIAVAGYITELRDRIAELESGKGRPRAKRDEAAERAAEE